MTFGVTKNFQKRFQKLSQIIQRQVGSKLKLWERAPSHGSLRFKRLYPGKPYWSLRITGDYRLIGRRDDGHVVWFWIGNHNDYDNIKDRLR